MSKVDKVVSLIRAIESQIQDHGTCIVTYPIHDNPEADAVATCMLRVFASLGYSTEYRDDLNGCVISADEDTYIPRVTVDLQ